MGKPVSDEAARLRTDGTVVRSWYTEKAPPPPARSVVALTWSGDPGWNRKMRLVPDGCLDISWDGANLTVTPAVAGPITLTLAAPGTTIGVRLLPHAAVAVLGRPAPTLDSPVRLDELWSRRSVAQLTAQLSDATPAHATNRLIGAVVERSHSDPHQPDPLLAAFVSRLDDPAATVTAAARTVGASTRELRRRLRNDTALTPRALHDVLRFRRALIALGGAPLVETAANAGYCDQAHLSRRIRKLTDTTPTQLATTRRQRPPASPPPSRTAAMPEGSIR